jgi:hypothetical protein
MKFGVNVLTFEATPVSYTFQFTAVCNNNMEDTQTSEVWPKLSPSNMETWNDVWQ